jgi:tetratricopeptide (TPR) repeat protein
MADYKNYSLSQLENCKQDRDAWYYLGMAYMERGDLSSAAEWLSEAMNDPGNEWEAKAGLNLGLVYKQNSEKDKALAILEKNLSKFPSSPMTKLNVGFLYAEGTESKPRDLVKALRLVEEVIAQLIQEDGNDDYLAADEFFTIAIVYFDAAKAENSQNYFRKAEEYFNKTIRKSGNYGSSGQKLREMAENCLKQVRTYI